MKNLFRNIILTLGLLNLVSVPAYPALTVPDTARLVYQNLLDNPGFENGNTKWTASGGATKTANTTAKGTGNYGYDWDSNGAAQTLTSTAVTIPAGMQGQNAYLTCGIKTPSGTATHTINAFDGTNILASTTITTSSTRFAAASLNFVMPTSGTIAIRIRSVASNEPEIYIDDCYLGLAYNISTSTNVTNPVAYTPTLTGFGVASSINVQSWRDGAYLFVEGTFTSGTATATEARINLGYNGVDGNVTTLSTLPTVSIVGQLTTSDTAATAPWNILVEASKTYVTIGRQWNTYSGLAKQNGSAVAASSVVVSFAFRVPIQGWSAEPSFRPDLAAVNWSGKLSGVTKWTTASSSFVDVTSPGWSLTTTASSNLSVSQYSTNPGITFTPPHVGRYDICFAGAIDNATSGSISAIKLTDGTTDIVGEIQANASGAAALLPVSGCGTLNITSLSAINIRAQLKAFSGTAEFGNGGAITFTVKAVDQGFPAPILIGSVTNASTGAIKHESAQITVSNSAAAVVTQMGSSWVSVANGAGAGLTTATISGFSGAPACQCTVIGAASTSASWCGFTAEPTSTTLLITRTRAGAAENGDVNITCTGPK